MVGLHFTVGIPVGGRGLLLGPLLRNTWYNNFSYSKLVFVVRLASIKDSMCSLDLQSQKILLEVVELGPSFLSTIEKRRRR